MKIFKIVKRILWEIFDFFCGDWWNLLGLAVTVILIYSINNINVLSFLQPADFFLYPVLIGSTLMFALNKAAKNKNRKGTFGKPK